MQETNACQLVRINQASECADCLLDMGCESSVCVFKHVIKLQILYGIDRTMFSGNESIAFTRVDPQMRKPVYKNFQKVLSRFNRVYNSCK
ncbi:hypothetical protein TNIN_70121 [Trichonephila inaurata madagascariensis]|uniref:Uncharacterized protein n=1 Tax=Trichonephila inaurata madagascariensis TaxID=2747483 RepID=A0A8X6XZD1_9ARAC|nr:hypothetical protein TNIN_70121 [Trichonephila inaurata madagascariensis]